MYGPKKLYKCLLLSELLISLRIVQPNDCGSTACLQPHSYAAASFPQPRRISTAPPHFYSPAAFLQPRRISTAPPRFYSPAAFLQPRRISTAPPHFYRPAAFLPPRRISTVPPCLDSLTALLQRQRYSGRSFCSSAAFPRLRGGIDREAADSAAVAFYIHHSRRL